ncbi:extracellular solute-binding protein [Paenibacillus mesophilus]|uniref:extracellular solute-binding protein n=1 Tax=Paenibacillus mesophilus TaxID=2582849 RepID=UPI00110DCB02|nr:extracellular solute-binding protein [Paenibacillus mesophilus]TMV47888.1 extracellular solute-binding protein [Paenibacillus mesophilus]
MIGKKKAVSVLMASVLLSTVLAAGCSSKSEPPASKGSRTSTNAEEKRIKMSMFMNNSGIAHPEGVDPSNNPYINIVEDYANVDLEVEVPNYTDFKTKFNLMLSSGNLPDILHTVYADETNQRADEGAFLDLKAFYDKSPIIQKYITPGMMEMAKSSSGHFYRIPMSWTSVPQGEGVMARYDLVVKYNEGKWPETVEEWIDLLRKIKKAEPNSLPMSNRVVNEYGIAYGGLPIFYWHGARPNSYRIEGGKVVSTFTLPEYKAAVVVMKQLYDEGLLDKEFATTDGAKWTEKRKNRNVLFEVNTADQMIPTGAVKLPEDAHKETQIAPPLKKYPSVLKDTKYVQPKRSYPINAHGLYISSKTKDKDRAWKVIEGFASDKLHEAIFWGKEGEDFKIENGKKLPIDGQGLANANKRYALHLSLIFGFNDRKESSIAAAEKAMDKDEFKRRMDGMKMLEDAANATGLALDPFVVLSADTVSKKTESNQFISTATIEAIMGKITLEQFDQKVEEYKKKYGFIYDEYTKYMNQNKDRLKKLGVKEVDW